MKVKQGSDLIDLRLTRRELIFWMIFEVFTSVEDTRSVGSAPILPEEVVTNICPFAPISEVLRSAKEYFQLRNANGHVGLN